MTKILWLLLSVLFVSKLAGWITASWWLILVPGYLLAAWYLFLALIMIIAFVVGYLKDGDD